MKKTSLLIAVIGLLINVQTFAQGRIDFGKATTLQQCDKVSDDGFTATFSFNNLTAKDVKTEKGVFSNTLTASNGQWRNAPKWAWTASSRCMATTANALR